MSNLFDVAVERDWVVQLVGMNNEEKLAQSNAVLRRFDQSSEFIGTCLYGWLLLKVGTLNSLQVCIGCVACAMPLQVKSNETSLC